MFLRCGGAIHRRVTGVKHDCADLEQGEVEIPCILKFEGDGEKLRSLLDKTQKYVNSALSKAKDKAQSAKKHHHKEEGEEVPETKKMKLSECDLTDWQNDIMKGEMLSDIPINIAQHLLKKQFPNLKGLQLTVY